MLPDNDAARSLENKFWDGDFNWQGSTDLAAPGDVAECNSACLACHMDLYEPYADENVARWQLKLYNDMNGILPLPGLPVKVDGSTSLYLGHLGSTVCDIVDATTLVW